MGGPYLRGLRKIGGSRAVTWALGSRAALAVGEVSAPQSCRKALRPSCASGTTAGEAGSGRIDLALITRRSLRRQPSLAIAGECQAPRPRSPGTILIVTRERWAQSGITIQFLIVVRTLGEIFRLRHVLGTEFSAQAAMPYVGGALIAACLCWAGVTLYFFRRFVVCAAVAAATVAILIAYKVAVIGW